VGVFKTLLKLTFLLVALAALAGVIALVRRSSDSDPVSFDEWPDVPRNPAS
jgi:hypothetical protein